MGKGSKQKQLVKPGRDLKKVKAGHKNSEKGQRTDKKRDRKEMPPKAKAVETSRKTKEKENTEKKNVEKERAKPKKEQPKDVKQEKDGKKQDAKKAVPASKEKDEKKQDAKKGVTVSKEKDEKKQDEKKGVTVSKEKDEKKHDANEGKERPSAFKRPGVVLQRRVSFKQPEIAASATPSPRRELFPSVDSSPSISMESVQLWKDEAKKKGISLEEFMEESSRDLVDLTVMQHMKQLVTENGDDTNEDDEKKQEKGTEPTEVETTESKDETSQSDEDTESRMSCEEGEEEEPGEGSL